MKESNSKLPRGLWPVMLTPFNIDKSIDYKSLEILTDYYISTGANGLFANCFSSEMYQLTETERLEMTKAIVDFSKGRLPIVATGSFYKDTDKNIEFIKKIKDQGVDAVVLISSILVDSDENETVLKNRIEKILEGTGNIPMGMYECPYPYKRCVSPETMKWLADTDRFIIHKDTTCKAALIKEKIDILAGTPLQVYNAHTPDALECLQDGAYGLCPISANFFPELYIEFFRLFNSGNFEVLKKLNSKMVEMDFIVHQQTYPLSAKKFLNRRGLDIGSVSRVPANGNEADHINFEILVEKAKNVFSEFDIKGFEM